MAELEKAIRGLECCSTYDDYSRKSCRECPYNEPDGKRSCKLHQMRVDALSLLKAQKPRVMTLEEAYCADECWYESVNGSYGYCDLCYDSKEDLAIYTTHGIKNAIESAYNKTWRCWTARPTDEQRKKAKWE